MRAIGSHRESPVGIAWRDYPILSYLPHSDFGIGRENCNSIRHKVQATTPRLPTIPYFQHFDATWVRAILRLSWLN